MTTADIKALLQAHGIVPNRALGQNFLADEAAAQTIVAAVNPNQFPVLEIAPGLAHLRKCFCSMQRVSSQLKLMPQWCVF